MALLTNQVGAVSLSTSVRIELADGYYVGTSPDGKTATGNGKRFWKSHAARDYYEGDVLNGQADGRGIMHYKSGNRAEGYFADGGYLEGFGTYSPHISPNKPLPPIQ